MPADRDDVGAGAGLGRRAGFRCRHPRAAVGAGPGWRLARSDQGQSTVELALVLPFVVLLLLLVVQVGIAVHDQVVLTHAAREAARAAAVTADADAPPRAARGAGRLDPSRLSVTSVGRAGPGSVVHVHLEYRSPVALPLLRLAVHDVVLHADAAMRVET